MVSCKNPKSATAQPKYRFMLRHPQNAVITDFIPNSPKWCIFSPVLGIPILQSRSYAQKIPRCAIRASTFHSTGENPAAARQRSATAEFFMTHPILPVLRSIFLSLVLWGFLALALYAVYTLIAGH